MSNKQERVKMVKAMEFIARNINDEGIFESWLMCGVPDGDIEYGDLTVSKDDEELLDCFIDDDKDFADIIDLFMRCMVRARKSGGLYVDGVCAGEKEA